MPRSKKIARAGSCWAMRYDRISQASIISANNAASAVSSARPPIRVWSMMMARPPSTVPGKPRRRSSAISEVLPVPGPPVMIVKRSPVSFAVSKDWCPFQAARTRAGPVEGVITETGRGREASGGGSLAGHYEAAFVCHDHELGAIPGVELGHDAADVRLRGQRADEKVPCYLVV